jgi:hypothetical protein
VIARSASSVWLVLVWVAVAGAAARLELTGESRGEVRLHAVNAGDEPAEDVAPEASYQHRLEVGESVQLAPGARYDWRFAPGASMDAGSFPVTIRVRYRERRARRMVPLVVIVGGDPAAPDPIRSILEVGPVAHHASARLVLENGGARAAAGRVVFVLPDGLTTEPESQPVRVGAAGRAVLPLVLQNEGGLPPGWYPVYAVFEWADGPTARTSLARVTVDVVPSGRLERARPLLVGVGALVVTIGLLALAWRASRER